MTRKSNGICMWLFRIFRVLMIVMDMNIGKAYLRISLVILNWQLRRNANIPDLSWMEKLIIGGKTTIGDVDLDFSCKVFFVLGMFHTLYSIWAQVWTRARESTNHISLRYISGDLRWHPKASSKQGRKEWQVQSLQSLSNLMFSMSQSQKLLLSWCHCKK